MTDEDKNKKRCGPKPKHRETIRKLHDAGYTQNEIKNETGLSKGYISKVLKKYIEDDPVNYYKVFSSDEESKDHQKPKPIEEKSKNPKIESYKSTEKPLRDFQSIASTPARNITIISTQENKLSKKLKTPKIKLYLDECSSNNEAIAKATRNWYRWILYNLKEIKELEYKVKLSYDPPEFLSNFELTLLKWLESLKENSYYSDLTDKLYSDLKNKFPFLIEKTAHRLSNEVLNLTIKDHDKLKKTLCKIKEEFKSYPECLDKLEDQIEAYSPHIPKTLDEDINDSILLNKIYEAIISKETSALEIIMKEISKELYNMTFKDFNLLWEYIAKIKLELNPCPESIQKLYRNMESYREFAISRIPTAFCGSTLGKELFEAIEHRDYNKAKKILYVTSNSLTYLKREDIEEILMFISRIETELYPTPKVITYINELVDLWKRARTKELYKTPITPKDIFKEYKIEIPNEYEPVQDQIIENRWELERTGIFEKQSYRILEEIKKEDQLEYWYHHYDELDSFEKTYIKSFLLTNEYLKTHTYYVLLKDKIQYNEIKTDD